MKLTVSYLDDKESIGCQMLMSINHFYRTLDNKVMISAIVNAQLHLTDLTI